jgi:serine/threonine protein kinase
LIHRTTGRVRRVATTKGVTRVDGTAPAALRNALADRYLLERELGQGGMATVYLAEDVRHHRKVAVKVLRPELAATLGPDRFLREIETAAQFQYPHILPLLDSGEASGFVLRHALCRRGSCTGTSNPKM